MSSGRSKQVEKIADVADDTVDELMPMQPGFLDLFMALPRDMRALIIANYLDPTDYRLSRTSQAMYDLFHDTRVNEEWFKKFARHFPNRVRDIEVHLHLRFINGDKFNHAAINKLIWAGEFHQTTEREYRGLTDTQKELLYQTKENDTQVVLGMHINTEDITCETKLFISPLKIAHGNNNEEILDCFYNIILAEFYHKKGIEPGNTSEIKPLQAVVPGKTLLMLAVYCRQPADVIQHLIQHGQNIEAIDLNKCAVIFLAVASKQLETTKLLLNKGAKTNLRDLYGNTPLYIAIKNNWQQGVELLLNNKANPDLRSKSAKGTLLHFSIEKGLMEYARLLLEYGADPDSERSYSRETPLIIATTNGNMPLAKLLIAHKVDVNKKMVNSTCSTALQVAAKCDQPECMALLLANGADPAVKANRSKRTALHFAADKNNRECAQLLLDAGAKPSVKDLNGNTALHYAAENGAVNMAMLLLDHGAGVNCLNKNKQTPLHFAALRGKVKCLRLLLRQPNINVNYVSTEGYTPLIMASKGRKIACLLTLLETGKCNIPDKFDLFANESLKDDIIRYIKNLKNNGQKNKLCDLALDKSSPLGKIMWMKRKKLGRECRLGSGSLKEIQKIKDSIPQQKQSTIRRDKPGGN